MKKIIIIFIVVTIAAVLISGIIPTRHTFRSETIDYSFETGHQVSKGWGPVETYDEPGWLVKFFTERR